jgi:DcuC family C4-dicarboxylate transporter
MRAAGFSTITIGASLLVGASVGGELLNPSAVELLAVKAKTGTDLRVLSWEYIPPLVFPVLVVTTGVLWWLCGRAGTSDPPAVAEPSRAAINYFQAFVPLVPLALLFASGPPLNLIAIPPDWVAVKAADTPNPDRAANSRLIGLAMLIGVAVAALAAPRKAGGCMKAFFDGAGYGFANITSLIVIAQCFGTALAQVGLAAELGRLVEGTPGILKPLAAAMPCLFAVVCGSGIASSAALYPTFYDSSVGVGANPDEVGALVSVGSAVGRTLSPVSAVCLMCATLTGTKATDLAKRVAVPLLAGLTVAVLLHLSGVWLAVARLFGGGSP